MSSIGIRCLKLKNFREVHADISNIPPGTKWIFISGKNGFGKTCVLQGIFIGLFGSKEENVTIEEDFDGKFWGCLENNIQHPDHKSLLDNRILIPDCVVAYGSSRLAIQAENESKNSIKGKSLTYYSLFNPDGILLNIESELKNWYYRANNKELAETNPELAQKLGRRFQKVKDLLLRLLPNLDDMVVDSTTNEIIYYEKDEYQMRYEEQRSFDQLASGNRSIIAMIGDMLIRLYRKQEVDNPWDLEGIVIIDELDLHLHPTWQKALPSILSKEFPKIQFIASTHSPIPYLGAPKESVILKVSRDKEQGIVVTKLDISPASLLPNSILTSPIFDFEDLIAESASDTNEVRTEDSYSEIVENDIIKERLKRVAERIKATKNQ